jgi:hypothetical protein
MHRPYLLALLAGALLAGSVPAAADEGMWTYNDFPVDRLAKAHGFTPDAAWLEKARLASGRFGFGCSTSFVSPNGLVMTNHHCVHSCVEQLSTAKRNYVADGFYAKTAAEELRCPELELDRLEEITDVTDRLAAATRGLAGEAYLAALKAEMARLEKACATGPEVRCDVVTLYGGGRYDLYRYHRYADVRLAFVPEFAIAFFGGDPDNFEFPRHDLDVAFLRIYEGGKPVPTPVHFGWSAEGTRDGDLTFTSGNPASTSRQMTVAELELERDIVLPRYLLYAAELRGMLNSFADRGPEQRRIANTLLFYTENGVKSRRGMYEALLDGSILAGKRDEERTLRAKVAADPALAAATGAAWDEVAAAQAELRRVYDRWTYLEGRRPAGFRSQLFAIARTLVRAADELPKPSDRRLREFGDAALPELEHGLASTAPIHAELEVETLAFSLTKLRETLGADDATVRLVLGDESPREAATRLVRGTKVFDPKVRRALWDGGARAIAASKDPMIALARAVDPEARAIRKVVEDRVEAPTRRAAELIARARFAVYGTGLYPDATGTLRLSFGTVRGWEENGKTIAPYTTFGEAFSRATGRDPFALPQSWLAAKDRLALATPFDLVTTNDIVGGNSGSPLFDRDLNIVGLVFDGNLPSLGGDYGFDETVNRTVAVDVRALTQALDRIYGAKRLLDEIRGPTVAKAR